MTELVNRSGAPIGAAAIDAFAAGLAGGVIGPGDADYDAARRIWNAAIDRRPGLIVRCRGTADVIAAVNFARANDLARHGARRRPQRRRPGALRRRARHRPLRDARGHRRSRGADRARPGRRDPRRHRPRDPRCTGSRCRRASSRAPASPGSPSAAASAGWCASTASPATTSLACELVTADGGVVTASAERAPGPLLGAQGRRRQLRRRHRLHLPRPPGLDRARRPAGLAARPGRRRSCASTATSWRARRRSSPPTARWSPPRTAAGLRRRSPAGRATSPRASTCSAPLRGFGAAGRRHDPADALPGDAADARRRLPGRHAQLLARELRARPDRRGDRHHRRARQPHGLAALGDADRVLRRRAGAGRSRTSSAFAQRVVGLQHRHDRAVDRPGGEREAHRLDARLLRRDRAARPRQPLPELQQRGRATRWCAPRSASTTPGSPR